MFAEGLKGEYDLNRGRGREMVFQKEETVY